MIENPFKKYTGSKTLLYGLIAALAIALAIIFINDCKKVKSDVYTLYIGGYGNAAYKYTFNTKNGEFTKQQEYKAVNPSYLTISPDSKFLYATCENGAKSSIAAFNTATGELLNEADTEGKKPHCWLVGNLEDPS